MSHETHAASLSLDPRSLRFPTDCVTLGDMRRVDPWVLDIEPADASRIASTTTFVAHRAEVLFAQRAYERAAGRKPSNDGGSRTELVSLLNCAYRELGLSRGLHQTREMVREIESQAAGQALSVSKGR